MFCLDYFKVIIFWKKQFVTNGSFTIFLFMEPSRKIFRHFWLFAWPFTPLTTLIIKIKKNWRKCLKMLSFYTCTINDNHIMYGSWCMMDDSWDMERDWLNCLSFCTLFWPYTPLTTRKFKILTKEKKKQLEIFSFYTSVP